MSDLPDDSAHPTILVSRFPVVGRIAGALLLGSGLYVLLPSTLGWHRLSDDKPSHEAIVRVFGSLLLLLGCGLVTPRRLLIIDTRSRAIATAWGWLSWLQTTAIDIGAWRHVVAGPRDIRGRRNSKRTVYPVSLHGSMDTYECATPSDALPALQLAERIAHGARLPYRDRTETTMGTEDATVDHPASSNPVPAPRPGPLQAPANTRITIDSTLDGCTITIPPPQDRVGQVIVSVVISGILTALPMAVWLMVRDPHGTPDPRQAAHLFHYLPPIVFGLCFIVILCWTLRQVRVSPWRITVDASAGLRIDATTIAADDLHDLRVVGKDACRALLIRSSRALLHVGTGESPADLTYVRDCILRSLRPLP